MTRSPAASATTASSPRSATAPTTTTADRTGSASTPSPTRRARCRSTIDLDNVADDGQNGELDNVRSNVENVIGGSNADTIHSLGAFSRLEGRGGDDHLFGGFGPDTLIGGPGEDELDAGSGVDTVSARDGETDDIDCGTETRHAHRRPARDQRRRLRVAITLTVGRPSQPPHGHPSRRKPRRKVPCLEKRKSRLSTVWALLSKASALRVCRRRGRRPHPGRGP